MKYFFVPAALGLFILSSCSADQQPTEAPMPEPAQVTAVPEQLPAESAADPDAELFDTGISIRTLMNAVIQPNATNVWQAMRYVVTANGVEEDIVPETDEDWARLRTSAITLVEAGNALLLPGRAVDHEIPGADYPAYTYRPEEIQAMIEADQEAWRYYVQEMQFSTKTSLESIERRDMLGLTDTSARINNACDGCHAQFWYRPNN